MLNFDWISLITYEVQTNTCAVLEIVFESVQQKYLGKTKFDQQVMNLSRRKPSLTNLHCTHLEIQEVTH